MPKQIVRPARTISGSLEVPGDKSISHRYALLGALAEGTSEITHFSAAADCRSTLDCFARMGVKSDIQGDRVKIEGAGLNGLRKPRRTLDAGNSGTTMRLLSGILAGQEFKSTLDGDASLRRRPMRRVMEPLSKMGARIQAREGGFAPLKIEGTQLSPINYTLPVPSAQVKSSILLAGLFADGVTAVTEPVRTRDHTELALAEFGCRLEPEGRTIRIHGRPQLKGRKLAVPGDLSSAVFFLAAAMVLPESNLVIHNVGLNPTRSAVLDVLGSMGAPVSLVSIRSEHGELVGDVSVRHEALQGGSIEGDAIAQLIDELPAIAVLGPYTEQGIEIRNAAELRIKESDRIAVLAENLRRMGAKVEELPDGLRVAGRSAGRLHGAEIDPHGDHRMAMAFAVAALGADGETVIRDAECAAVSYPDFFATLERLVER
ncbi:MAG TPA: 3-phosphoshikimate 1-carboxyvinyltransferase [Candidatus Acidoferrales bacterium]|nr:3-phosphoshikimate 1-carboxyvinyltransferase [Candidatus Acidoferrales bacterium]